MEIKLEIKDPTSNKKIPFFVFFFLLFDGKISIASVHSSLNIATITYCGYITRRAT